VIRVAPLDAFVKVAIADARLATIVENAIERAIEATRVAVPPFVPPIVRLRTQRRLDRLGGERIAGKLVIVRVTTTNARRLPDLVERIRALSPAGVELVWDPPPDERSRSERYIFAVLEKARATPAGPPVVVARSCEPDIALSILMGHRREP
jgi:hypothetical protein